MGVRAVHIYELLPCYHYKCTMDDAVAKEEIKHIKHMNRSVSSQLAKRCLKAEVSLFRTIWDRELEMHACASCKEGFCEKSHHNAFLSPDHVHLALAGYTWLCDRIIQTAYLASQDFFPGVTQSQRLWLIRRLVGVKKNILIKIKMLMSSRPQVGFCTKYHHNAFLSPDHVHLTPAGYTWFCD